MQAFRNCHISSTVALKEKTMRIKNNICAAALFALTAAPAAQATLIGDTVNCGITPTPFWICTTPSAIVGPGIEFELDLPIATNDFGFFVDIGASSITIGSNEDNGFGLGASELLTLSDLDWVGTQGIIVGIENFTSFLVSGLAATDVTFTDHSVTIDIDSGASWNPGSFVSFDLVTTHVPEPGTLPILGFGLAAIGFARRKRA